ncbi:MAG: hypothetical protein WBQ25_19520, partial [Nitrososphaeraceae archaeon]
MKVSSRTTSTRTDQINIASKTKKHPLVNENEMVCTYLTSIAAVNESTAIKYNERLKKFGLLVSTHYNNSSVDNIVVQIKKNTIDVYNLLGKYVLYLKQSNNSISPNSLKNHIITVKNFLEYSDIDISPRKFKLKVRLPKIIRKNKEALSKEDVVDILNACSDIRLKTYVMFLAAGGFRAVEALSVRVKDLDL